MKKITRYYAMAYGFILSVFFYIFAFLSRDFIVMCVLMFIGCFANAIGNAVFNASIILAMPEERRAAMLGVLSSASMGGCALSAVIFGVLGEIMPLYMVFVGGNVLSIAPMFWMCLHKNTKEFIVR